MLRDAFIRRLRARKFRFNFIREFASKVKLPFFILNTLRNVKTTRYSSILALTIIRVVFHSRKQFLNTGICLIIQMNIPLRLKISQLLVLVVAKILVKSSGLLAENLPSPA